jgi:AcrR family transcriptional regulator
VITPRESGDDSAQRIKLQVDSRLFLKDPTSSELGEDIVEHGILMLDEIGFEEFTFRKLAQRIGTTEASIYRYFKNKHFFLLYLTSWYWGWVDYRLQIATSGVADASERLLCALHELTRPIVKDDSTPRIDEIALYRVVVAESSKAYLQREVDSEEREGFFRGYKRVCSIVADMVRAVNPRYAYPTALVSMVVESSHTQKYFAKHLPGLTDVKPTEAHGGTTEFLIEMVFRVIAG